MKNLIAIPFLMLSLAAGCGAPADDLADDEMNDLFESDKSDARRAKFEIFAGANGQSYFNLIAANGEKLLTSQGYASKQGAVRGVASVKTNGKYADSYQILEAKNGEFYFNLLAGNWATIGTSELYSTKSNAERAIDTAVKTVKTAKITK